MCPHDSTGAHGCVLAVCFATGPTHATPAAHHSSTPCGRTANALDRVGFARTWMCMGSRARGLSSPVHRHKQPHTRTGAPTHRRTGAPTHRRRRTQAHTGAHSAHTRAHTHIRTHKRHTSATLHIAIRTHSQVFARTRTHTHTPIDTYRHHARHARHATPESRCTAMDACSSTERPRAAHGLDPRVVHWDRTHSTTLASCPLAGLGWCMMGAG